MHVPVIPVDVRPTFGGVVDSASRLPGVAIVRRHIGQAVFRQVAGPHGEATRQRIHATAGQRRFSPDDPIARVHDSASMFVGGLRALLLQTLHPLVVAAVADHSAYREDPWGRLAATSTFLADTTFGTTEHAEQAIARVRAVHRRIVGTAPDGRPYRADDPHLLRWVHVAEVDSFLAAYQLYDTSPLSDADADTYLAQSADVAERLGATGVPRSRAALAAALDEFLPELAGTDQARDVVRFLLQRAPVPLAARAPYAALASAAVASLPGWARSMLRLPPPTPADALARMAGGATVGLIGWALAGNPPPRASERQPVH